MIRSVGGTIGYAILYNIYLSRSATTLPKEIAPRVSAAGLPQASIAPFIKQFIDAVAGGNLQNIPRESTAVIAAAHEGFRWGTTEASQLVYYVSVAFGAVATILALCLPNMKRYMTDKVLVRSKSQSW